MPGPPPSPLPFASANRPIAWTAAVLGVVALAMGGGTALFVYAYLAIRQGGWPPPEAGQPDLGIPLLATLVLTASALAAGGLQRGARDGSGAAVQASSAALVLLGALFLWLQAVSYPGLGLDPRTDGYASVFALVVGLHHLMALAGMGAAGVILLQVWSEPGGRLAGAAAGLAVYWWFVVAAWLAAFGVLYVSPLLWGPP